MELLIVTTQKDSSCNRIMEEANKKNMKVSKILYEKLSSRDLKFEKFEKFDFCILRDPYNSGRDFSIYLRTITNFFNNYKLLDFKTYNKYPRYEDKLFQHTLFKNIVTMPKFYHFRTSDRINIKSFPILIKKRLSSRAKGIFILNTKEEMNRFFKSNSITDYFFEEYLNIKDDIRVILVGNRIIGTVKRKFRFKENKGFRGIGVKVLSKYKLPEKIKKKAIIISKTIKSDFCGLDFIIDKNNKYYLIECNISPQFTSSERVLKKNIAKKLIEFISKSER